MKTKDKRRLDELIGLISKAQKEIKKFISINDITNAVTILENCQAAAISIGNSIDELEGEGTLMVTLLEEYCEVVFLLHQALLTCDEDKISEGINILDQKIIEIADDFDKEIPIIKEAVFLPYKASMWDSLESVWKKYNEDPNWDALVIPIGYYDKNPDGSMKEYHYEGKEFPADIPIIYFEDYDFPENHPDVIFIHNPYDNDNYITSVLPYFYSEQLKRYTDKLVYIPYFVLPEPKEITNKFYEETKHFARTKGVINSDEVIVQSENIKACYVRSLVEVFGEESRAKWEIKIKGSGSPKIDKIKNIDKSTIVLPDDWKKKIYKEDGGLKKIVLYNTSIAGILDNKEAALVKIREVLDIFEKYKNDIVLLWRPHPLIDATLSSMMPELTDEYNRIVNDYIESDFGIFDDTSDFDRALAISDAYYGDGSSVVALCQAIGMPILMQDVYVHNNYGK